MLQQAIIKVVKEYVDQLIYFGKKEDIAPLLTPENTVVRLGGITLKQQIPATMPPAGIYEGYSAPEVYEGKGGPAAHVYFVGAVMYSMVFGAAPPPAPGRSAGQALVPTGDDPLLQVIDRALALDTSVRYVDLVELSAALAEAAWQTEKKARAEAPPPQPQPEQPEGQHEAERIQPGPQPTVAKADLAQGKPEPEKEEEAMAGGRQLVPPQKEPPIKQAAAPSPVLQRPPQKAPLLPQIQDLFAQIPVAEVAPARTQQFQNPTAVPVWTQPKDEPKARRAVAKSPNAGVMRPPAPPRRAPQPAPLPPEAILRDGAATPEPAPRPKGAVSPYVTQSLPAQQLWVTQQLEAQAAPQQKPKQRTGKTVKTVALALVVAVVLAAAVVGYNWMQKTRAEQAFAAGRYEEVVAAIDASFLFTDVLADQYTYSKAHVLHSEGRLTESLALFVELGDFADSPAMSDKVQYDMAIQMAEAGDLQNARRLFEEMDGYGDSAGYIAKIDSYRAADAQADLLQQYLLFGRLGGFYNSDERMNALRESLYTEAQNLYTQKNFADALVYFEALEDYQLCAEYLAACQWYADVAAASAGAEEAEEEIAAIRAALPQLRQMSLVVEAGPLAMADPVFYGFLEGVWQSDDGGGSFEFSAEEGYLFSEFSISGRYRFTGGQMVPMRNGPAVQFEYVAYDEITITVEGNPTYSYTRQG